MKIAIPVQDKSIEASMHDSFGRAPYYLLYNTNTKENDFLDHRASVAQGGSGIRAAQVLADNGVKAVITKQCGENAEKVFSNAEVLVYEAIPGSVRQNIEALIKDELRLMSKFKTTKKE
ncbi:MAG: NifB/NifX family molybdenum-iron cluster-binding protein [Eubacteriales bacterium]|nr:NifB/NifX family molybdenum-iron cluster-binding protein [Eubacteriales bacterium]